jgi:hypothetical protein
MDTRTQAGTMSREMGDRKNQASRLADSPDRDSRLDWEDRKLRENLERSDLVLLFAADSQVLVETLFPVGMTSQASMGSLLPVHQPAGIQAWVETQIPALRPADSPARVDILILAGTMSREMGDRKNQASLVADTLDRDSRLLPADTPSRENLDMRGSILRPADNRVWGDTRIQAGTTSRESKVSWTQGLRLEDSQAWMDTQIQEDRTIRVNLEKWIPVLRPAGSWGRAETPS